MNPDTSPQKAEARRRKLAGVDPAIADLARAIQRERCGATGRGSVLGPVRFLLAEFVYLEMAPREMYAFVQAAKLDISYNGMHAWVRRSFESAEHAGKILQEAVSAGVFSSPYFSVKPRSTQAMSRRQKGTL